MWAKTSSRVGGGAAGLVLAAACAGAAASQPGAEACAEDAAARHAVNATMLRAVLRVEAREPLPVVVVEADGRVDIGGGRTARFSPADLERRGIAPSGAGVGCIVAHAAAWRLGNALQSHGNTWQAVGAFASDTTYYNNRYQALVHNELVRMGAMQSSLRRVPSLRPSESPDAPGVNELVIYQIIIQDQP